MSDKINYKSPWDIPIDERGCQHCAFTPNDGKCTGINCFTGMSKKIEEENENDTV